MLPPSFTQKLMSTKQSKTKQKCNVRKLWSHEGFVLQDTLGLGGIKTFNFVNIRKIFKNVIAVMYRHEK